MEEWYMGDPYIASDKRYDHMKYNHVGKSGLKFPAVSLGFWHNFGNNGFYDNMKAICRTAFDNGITQFDLANNYGPEYGRAEINAGQLQQRPDMICGRDLMETGAAESI